MNKRLFSIIAIAALALGIISPVFAGPYDRENGNEAGYVKSVATGASAEVVAAPCYVHAVTLYASTANAEAAVYDSTTGATGGAKIELGKATQYESTRYVFDTPVKFDNGVYVVDSNGYVVVEYR